MSILSENMRYLRGRLGFSQQKVADSLIITRGRYAKYEDGASEPPIEVLLKISRYYHVSIDLLVSVDLRKIPITEILELPDNRIILPIVVDGKGDNKIEIITQKATMGYLAGYSDPEYIENLPRISLPFLPPGNYRGFPSEGDSMPPHKDESIIVGKYVENLSDLKIGKTYIFITRSEGITYKRLNQIDNNLLRISADNPFYEPYTISFDDILEIWEYSCSIAKKEFAKNDFNLDSQNILKMFEEIKIDINRLRN